MKTKVLILSNPLNHEGGVVNYYNLFFKHFESNRFVLVHKSIGSRAYLFYYPILKRLLYPFYFLFDFLTFFLKILFQKDIKIIQVNPSLIPVPLIRDGLLIVMAKILGKKVVVFYRGWKLNTFSIIRDNSIYRKIFNKIFQKNTMQVVLATEFKKNLLSLYGKPNKDIIVTTTAIDRNKISMYNQNLGIIPIKVLFLSRIEPLKGIEDLVDGIILLKEKGKLDTFNFSIVGHEGKKGYISYLENKLRSHGITDTDVRFMGRITGEQKYQLYANHHIYVLPSYTEGCPNSLLEALASGLFCITTNVGALSDLIVPKYNGLLVNKKDGEDLYSALIYCAQNIDFNENRKKRSEQYSNEFDIKKIIKLFETKYLEIIEGK